MSSSEHDMGNPSIPPLDQDVLIDPALDYLNSILMDEAMDNSCTSMDQQDNTSYEAIVNSFYQILDEQSPYSASFQPPPHIISTPLSASSGSSGSLQSSFQVEAVRGDVRLTQGLGDVSVTAGNVQLPDKRRLYPREAFASAASGGCNIAHQYSVNLESKSIARQQQGSVDQPTPQHGLSRASSEDVDVSFVKNKDFNIQEHYANLYIGESPPAGRSVAVGKGRASADQQRASASSKKKVKGKQSDDDAGLHVGSVDFEALLVSCAQAVAKADARKANDILQELRQCGASPQGTGLQRMAHYFSEALMARMCGTGSRLYSTAMSNNRQSSGKILKAFTTAFAVCPYVKIMHYFANQSILTVAEGASRLHVVDYGILSGMQWPCLMCALADRKEGPPFLHITGIDFPKSGPNPAESLDNTGRRLAEYARTYKVPFEYNAVASIKWEEIEPGRLHLRQGEVLVVNCHLRLRHVPDESTMVATSPRQQLLRRMRSLNPDILVTAVKSMMHSPFFVFRFREALHFFSSVFDMLDATQCNERSESRMIVERDFLRPMIINVVACEGVERGERPETHKQWQARIQEAGFQQLPIIPTVLSVSSSHVQNHYHKDFDVHTDSNTWMLLGWKGRTIDAISAWRPIPTT